MTGRLILTSIVLSTVILSAATAGGLELVPEAKSGPLTIGQDGAPVVSSHYVGWRPKWKFAPLQVKAGKTTGKTTPLTLSIASLGVSGTGSRTVDGTRKVIWTYNMTFSKAEPEAIGGGIEFQLKLDAPARQGATAEPVLLENNTGWSWEYRPGQTIKVSFAEPLANVYFERGRKNEIRTMFFGGIKETGKKTVTMTVEMPEGAAVAQSLASRYGETNESAWYVGAMNPHESFVDLSGMNHKPAGKYGFVKRRGDRFVLSATGKPIRFWGGNVQAYSLFIKDKALIKKHAQRLAKLGYNLVRLHHHDSARWVTHCLIAPGETSQKINGEALDSYFYWIKCLQDEGIYVWVDLLVGRPFREGDKIPGWAEDLARSAEKGDAKGKGYIYLNERMTELVQKFNKELLTRVNPYTKKAIKDDPAVMGVLVTNENELMIHFGNLFLADKNHPYHQKLFEAKRNAFAAKHGLDRNKVGQTWEMGEAKLLLADLEAAWNKKMIAHLRGLGLKVPIATCHVWGGASLLYLPPLTLGDMIDCHCYTNGEFLRTNPRFAAHILHSLGQSQVVNMPLAITEYNNEDRHHLNDAFTLPLYVASLGAFQSWDAPMLYGYSQDALRGTSTSAWSAYTHPAIVGLSPAAAMMFRGGHVAPARKTVVIAPSRDQLFMEGVSPKNSAALRTALETHRMTIAMPAVKELPWLKPSPEVPGAIVVTDMNRDFIPEGATSVTSDTGELKRDWKIGIRTVDTPKSQSAVGWLKGQTVKLADTTFAITTPKAAVVLTSLDDQPLKASRKILLSAVARVRKQGRQYLSEPVAGTVTLASSLPSLKLIPLKGDGTQGKPIPLQKSNGTYAISLPTNAGTHWFYITP